LKFDKIAIIGLGLIGGSLAAALKRKNNAATIIGCDFEAVIKKALALKIIDSGFPLESMSEGISSADLIFLAMPIRKIVETIKEISGMIKPGALVTDVGSTKGEIVKEAEKHLPGNVYFIGGHPMAGAERGGVENADALLFENAIYVLAENKLIPEQLVDHFVDLIESIGAKTVFLPAEQHDEIASVVSHLPQVLAVTLMNYAAKLNKENPAYLNLAAGGFRDMTRIASSPFDIWRDIIKTNSTNIELTIEHLIRELTAIKSMLRQSQIETLFDAAARSRLSIPKDTRGFLRPHFDVFVVVEDKPGVIAGIANSLAAYQINIKDIEVVKIREGDSGTIRLALESEVNRNEAIKILNNIGFVTRVKD
jgi:prephenate dehydrogenase